MHRSCRQRRANGTTGVSSELTVGPKPLVTTNHRCHRDQMWIDAKGSMVLAPPECMRLLAVSAKDGGVGRLGAATDQAPVVIPVNFTLRDGQVLVRVGTGFFSQAAAGHLVAFEVDHIDSAAGTAWSVLIRGLATLIEAPTEIELAAAAHPLVPEPGDMVLVVRPDILTGRRFEIRRAHEGQYSDTTGFRGHSPMSSFRAHTPLDRPTPFPAKNGTWPLLGLAPVRSLEPGGNALCRR